MFSTNSRRNFLKTSVALGTGYAAGALLSHHQSAQKTIELITPNSVPTRPSHLHWAFGDKENSSPLTAGHEEFRIWFDPVLKASGKYSFRKEVLDACRDLDRQRRGKPVALCLSGGIDSEVIALGMQELGIPFEMYFLDNWELNRSTYEQWIKPLASKLKQEVNVVTLERSYFREELALKAFRQMGVEYPTYLSMTHLFDSIPEDRFIVTGDGDLDRAGDMFRAIGNKSSVGTGTTGLYGPYATSSIAYHLWAGANKRRGQFYFFNSTPELLASVIQDPRFEIAYPEMRTKEVIHAAFPEIARRPKTSNWDTKFARQENAEIRKLIREYASQHEELKNWRSEIGTSVRLDGIFKKS